MFCENCGNKIEDKAKFCYNCGEKISHADTAEPVSNFSYEQTQPEDSVNQNEKCPKCGHTIEGNSKFCDYCGEMVTHNDAVAAETVNSFSYEKAQLEDSVKQNVSCPKCGHIIEGNSKFCDYCGEKVTSDMSAPLKYEPINHFSSLGSMEQNDNGFKNNASVITKKTSRPMIIAVIVIIAIFIAGIAGITLYENFRLKNDDENILDVKNAYVSEETQSVTENYVVENENRATTATTKTEVTERKEKTEVSEKYLIYLSVLSMYDEVMQTEYGSNNSAYYYIYDINHDGIYELLVHSGIGAAYSIISIYSINENGELIDVGELGGFETGLVEIDGELCTNYCRMSYQLVEKVIMGEDLGSWIITKEKIYEEDNLRHYKSYGIGIKGYDISDPSAIEALCPKEMLENRPYVDAHIEVEGAPPGGGEGYTFYLYVSGDFSYVSVEKRRIDDNITNDVNKYTYGEAVNGIEVYAASAGFDFAPVLYITPYNDSGVAGDTITCKISDGFKQGISNNRAYAIDNMKGQINSHGGTVAGYTTDYVVNSGAVGKVRNSLGDTWHVTAKNTCYNYGVTWYELWDSDDGDYYGWVDSNYIDFY